MDDSKMKRFLQDELKRDADRIVEEVKNDPDVAGIRATPEMHDKLFAQIRQYEEGRAYENLPEEYKELVDLGRVYKKKKKRTKYYVLAAAIVAAMAVGVTSIGGPERLFKEIQWVMGGREQVTINSDSEDVLPVEAGKEDEAYQIIEDELGFDPVRMLYLPKDMEFIESILDKEAKMAQLNYYGIEKKSIIYQMDVNYKQASVGFDVEDQLLDVYTVYNNRKPIEVKQYQVKGTEDQRWIIKFQHEGIQYFMTINNLKKGEIEKILKNLNFF